MLGYFLTPLPTVRSVPVCGSYCDRWFDACKDDRTCTSDWLTSYLQALDEGMNTCPVGSECMTFAELFGNGKGFCDNIWGDAYFYSQNEDNCTVMDFDPDMPNPNFRLSFGSQGNEVKASIGIMAFAMVQLYFMM